MRATLLILCLIGAPSPSPPNQKAAYPTESKSQSDTYPSKPTPAPPAITEKQTTAKATNQNGGTVASHPNERAIRIVGYPPRSTGEAVALVCTIILTLMGIAGIIVAVCTLRTIAQQTEATRMAAVAAQVSADALVNSERAWIDGELMRETFPAVRYRLKITNHGKTPARMLGYEIDCGCLLEGAEFPRERLSNRCAGKFHFLLGADKSRVLEEVEPLNMHVIFGGCLEAGAYCVTIRYADVVVESKKAQDRETSFVYYCRFLLDSVERISEYDKYT